MNSTLAARAVATQQPAAYSPTGNGAGGRRTNELDQAFSGALGSISIERRLEFLEYWRSLVKRKWAVLALGVTVALLAGLISYALTPVYRSSATVLIEAGKVKIISIEEVYGVSGQQREHFQTQMEILKSRGVAERTARALKLWERPEFDIRISQLGWPARLKAALGMDRVPERTNWTEEELVKASASTLMSRTSVTPVRGSQLVRVEVEGSDPALVAELANALSRQYIESEREERYKLTQQVSQQLQHRLTDLRTKLAHSEQVLQQYRERRGIVTLGGSNQALTGQALGETIKALNEAQGKRATLEAEYRQAKSVGADLGSIPSVARSPLVAEAQRNLANARSKLSDLQHNLGSAHFRVKQAQAEVEEMALALRRHQLAAVGVLTHEYEAARGTEQALSAFLSNARDAAQKVNRQEFDLAVLEREYQSNKQLFDVFISRAKETDLTGDLLTNVARTVDLAVPSAVPSKPNRTQIVVVSLILALLLGSVAAIVLDRLDNTIKGGNDAETRLHVPVLTLVPSVQNQSRPQIAHLYMSEPHSHYAEAMRTARTGVLLSNLDVPNKVLLITSSLPGEGKTTVAINLALAHAQTKHTLLIDCDMRRSQVGGSLGLAGGGKGLSNLVAGDASIDDCVFPIEDSSLLVMPVGTVPPNPLELLLSQRFKDALHQLSEQFEMVIIDSPPVELVSEALVLAPLVTSTVFVVKAMSTPAPLVRKSLTRLQRAGGNILGVVVNQLDFKRAHTYYGEVGAGGYAYGGYGYGGAGSLTYGKPAESGRGQPPAASAVRQSADA